MPALLQAGLNPGAMTDQHNHLPQRVLACIRQGGNVARVTILVAVLVCLFFCPPARSHAVRSARRAAHAGAAAGSGKKGAGGSRKQAHDRQVRYRVCTPRARPPPTARPPGGA